MIPNRFACVEISVTVSFLIDSLYRPSPQEGEQCGIPWATLVTRPPQHTLVVERMHSGARRYIVLDFGHLVRLTDLVRPSLLKSF